MAVSLSPTLPAGRFSVPYSAASAKGECSSSSSALTESTSGSLYFSNYSGLRRCSRKISLAAEKSERRKQACVCRRLLVAAASGKNDGQMAPWDIRRFARTVLFFNEPPSFNEVVSTLISPPKLIKAIGSIFGQSESTVTKVTAPGQMKEYVLVVGSTGGVGRRVVGVLKKKGFHIRAMVRDKEKGQRLLGDDVELVVADLARKETLLPVYFEGVTKVVSCFACIIGPKEGDTAERQKYMQGVKFFEPEVKGDSPEMVEYMGMKNLLDAVAPHLGLRQGKPLFSVSGTGIPAGPAWGALDDVVMGGVSESGFQIDLNGGENGEPVGIFKGFVSTDNSGGFASIRCKNFSPEQDLSAYEGIVIRLKGTGKRFKLIIRTETSWDTVGYTTSFDTKAGTWQSVYIPFSDFVPVFRAKTVQNGAPFNTSHIASLQLMYSKFEYDGKLNPTFEAGPFELPVASIKTYLKQPVTSRFVHVGSAGVTRPGRPGLDLDRQPPAVRMNDALGGLLTFKLKGEDALRESGIPYTIARPVALTEEPAGAQLIFEQGDNITGKISREDIAELCVACLSDPSALDKTFEVKSTVPFSTPFTVDPENPLPERDFSPFLSTLVEGITGKLEEQTAAASV